jgi:lysophospholipase L1-like esterase
MHSRDRQASRTARGKASVCAPTAWIAATAALFFALPALALDDQRCTRAAGQMQLSEPAATLPLASERGAGKPLTIVAIGSSSTEGHGGMPASAAYPAVMEQALRAQYRAPVTVLNRGKGGETIPDMLARFDRDVIAARPDMVIWQLGVNDVLARDGVESDRALIQAGIATLADHDIPVLLLDLQYAPRTLNDPDTPVMQAMIQHAVQGRRKVMQLKRYAAMQHLAEREAVPMAEMVEADGLHMTPRMHQCLGKLMAKAIGDAALPAPRATIADMR